MKPYLWMPVIGMVLASYSKDKERCTVSYEETRSFDIKNNSLFPISSENFWVFSSILP